MLKNRKKIGTGQPAHKKQNNNSKQQTQRKRL